MGKRVKLELNPTQRKELAEFLKGGEHSVQLGEASADHHGVGYI